LITTEKWPDLIMLAEEFGYEALVHQLNAVDRRKVDPVNWYFRDCPTGWTSLKTRNHFCSALDYLYVLDSDDEGSSEDKKLTDAETQKATEIAITAVDTAYDRTKARLAGSDDNFLISCLWCGASTKPWRGALDRHLKQLLGTYSYEDESIFMRDALWAIQLPAMQDNTDNFSYARVYACINYSKGRDENFIIETILPEMKRCGHGSMIPYPYDMYPRIPKNKR
jgi:hypothetical protein